jgi:CHAT domain-containing protein/Tfp pilus assembly protein PilF
MIFRLLRSAAALAVALVLSTGWLTPAVTQGSQIQEAFDRIDKLYASGNYAAALDTAKKLEATVKARVGPKHPVYAATLTEQAQALAALARYPEAERLYTRALTILDNNSADSADLAALALNGLGGVYKAQNKYAAAEQSFRRVLAIVEKKYRPNHVDVGVALNNLGTALTPQGRYDEAEELYRRALTIQEKGLGLTHPYVAQALKNLGGVAQEQGKYVEAEQLYKRALTIREAGADSTADVAFILNDLATVYVALARHQEAEALYRRALEMLEQGLGGTRPQVAYPLSGLANLYHDLGRYEEAERLDRRALAIREKALGPNDPVLAETLNNLGVKCEAQGKYKEAGTFYERAIAIRERTLGPNHPALAYALTNLATLHLRAGNYQQVDEIAKRAVAIRERVLGPTHPEVAHPLLRLSEAYRLQGKYAEAESLLNRVLAIREQAFGADHPDVADTFNDLAILSASSGDSENSLAYSRKATASVIAHAATETTGAQHKEGAGGLVEQRTDYFVRHVANLAAAAQKRLEPEAELGREALAMAQWAKQSAAAAAVQQMGLRFAAGTDALAALVRERQDLSAFWRDRDKALLAALSTPQGQQNPSAIGALRRELASIESKLAANTARLEREFPEYAALASPKPLKAEEVQQLLGADEALIFWLAGAEEAYVFALTRDGFDWRTIGIGAESLSEKVAAFRSGLDLDKLQKSAGNPVLFDLALAHELYVALIGPVEELVKDKRHLLAVPSGPLTSLAFHLLVTEKPAKAVMQVKDIALYRDAAWLIKRQAVSVLPSVASLRALRLFARKAEGTKAMIGFGDPIFDPAERARALAGRGATKSRAAVMTRAYSEFWQGANLDRKKLAQALPSLLETADELAAVAAKLGAPRSDIHLQKDANETTVKAAALANYRVVYFATHGLLAGDVKGLGEPSLALTIPNEPSELDDGLLTASEVAQLKLKADWVVLSACNTAAGAKPGAEALSGLARAFFYAGAHALLVSHWAVDSDAATRLTTTTFDILQGDPKLGRAEALRRAMLAYMNDATNPLNAYPALWAPFVVVGEGAAR